MNSQAQAKTNFKSFEVTFEHTGPYIDHTVTVEVTNEKDMLKEAHKAMKAEWMGLSDIDGYRPEPKSWKQVN